MIPAEVRKVFDKCAVIYFVTADLTGDPNAVPIAWKKITDSDRIILLDNYMNQSKRNIMDNRKVCLTFYDPEMSKAYKIKGNATYHIDDEVFEKGKRFMQEIEDNEPQGVVEIIVTGIYDLKPGPELGKKIA